MKKITFIGDGKTKDFYFSLPYFTKKDVVVELNGAPTTGFGLYCVSNGLNADIPFSGGRVCFTKPPKVASVISIYRKLELNRHVDYQPTKPINTMVLNQDMNFMLEVLKDMKAELSDFASQYAEITDTESTTVILDRIDTVMSAIDDVSVEITDVRADIMDLGDITTIHASIATLNTAVADLRTELSTANTNIAALQDIQAETIDYVVASQTPNADNNYTWYRKYKSGWVEMGGILPATNSTGNITFVLPIKMANSNYTAFVTPCSDSENQVIWCAVSIWDKTTTSFKIRQQGTPKNWAVFGVVA